MRFFFYSNKHEPIHIHVRNSDGEAKFDVEKNIGIKNKDLKLAESLIEENKDLIINSWKNHFNI